jgi:hypothetical protein
MCQRIFTANIPRKALRGCIRWVCFYNQTSAVMRQRIFTANIPKKALRSKNVYSDKNQEQRDAEHCKAFHDFSSYLKI